VPKRSFQAAIPKKYSKNARRPRKLRYARTVTRQIHVVLILVVVLIFVFIHVLAVALGRHHKDAALCGRLLITLLRELPPTAGAPVGGCAAGGRVSRLTGEPEAVGGERRRE
jgi:hypothetical protein